jgi:hypothetical protein
MARPTNASKNAKEFIARRRTVYVQTFNTPFGEEVMEDLARFCRAEDTTFHMDPRVHAALEGRREVYLRIKKHLTLSDEQLFNIFAVPQPQE